MKKFLSFFLSAIMAFSCFSAFGFAAKKEASFDAYVTAASAEAKDMSTTKWFKAENGEYYFFLSSVYGTAKSVKLWFDGDDVKINGESFKSGSIISAADGVLEANGASFKYHFLYSVKIASLYINTESGSMKAIDADPNHETEEAGMILISDASGKAVYDGKLKSIKGRGNASWKEEKKGYNIKLDEKTNLFKMGKSAKWCLIASHSDKSLMRNALIYGAALAAGMEFTPLYVPVDVYFNGEYNGSYILITKIEAAKTRINVENLDDYNEEAAIDFYDDEDFDMDTLERCGAYGKYAGFIEGTQKWVNVPEIKNEDYNVTGGYILEIEIPARYEGEISGFVSDRSQSVTFKCPEYASEEQIKYISDYYQRFEDAVFADSGKNAKGEAYSDLADIETFAQYYLISEWASNMDSGLTSTYLYKDVDGLLCAGPVWDYDISLGNNDIKRFGCDYTNPEEFTVCFGRLYKNTLFGGKDIEKKATIYNQLCTKPEFAALCKQIWDSGFGASLKNWAEKDYVKYAEKLEDSAIMNAVRWNIFDTCNIDEIRTAYKNEVKYVQNFAAVRADFLTANLGSVQKQNVEENPVKELFNKFLSALNTLLEKIIVKLDLVNKF